MKISERPVNPELLASIKQSALEGAAMIGVDPERLAPVDLVKAVDAFVHRQQKIQLETGVAPDLNTEDDPAMALGSLWGQQLVAELGWHWVNVTFREHDDSEAVGVVSADRSLAIYPLHFVYGCLENNAPVTIMLSYNILVDGTRIPQLPPHGFENVMDNVHHIIPRD